MYFAWHGRGQKVSFVSQRSASEPRYHLGVRLYDSKEAVFTSFSFESWGLSEYSLAIGIFCRPSPSSRYCIVKSSALSTSPDRCSAQRLRERGDWTKDEGTECHSNWAIRPLEITNKGVTSWQTYPVVSQVLIQTIWKDLGVLFVYIVLRTGNPVCCPWPLMTGSTRLQQYHSKWLAPGFIWIGFGCRDMKVFVFVFIVFQRWGRDR
jgi:hypothetical protein